MQKVKHIKNLVHRNLSIYNIDHIKYKYARPKYANIKYVTIFKYNNQESNLQIFK